MSCLVSSGWPNAQVPGPRSHRRDGFRVVGARQQPGSTATQRGGLRHPQPTNHSQDDRHQQSLWERIQPGSGLIG